MNSAESISSIYRPSAETGPGSPAIIVSCKKGGHPVATLPWRPWGSGLFAIDDIRSWVEENEGYFGRQTRTILRENHLDTPDSLTFQVSGPGNITLASDHDNRDAIETLINSSENVHDLFMIISATASFLRSVDENDQFRELYDNNPEAAVTHYGEEYALQSQYEFQLTVLNDTVKRGFAQAI